MEITPAITQDFLTFDDQQTLSSLLGQMKNFEKRSGLIFRNDKYVGLIEKKKILRTNVDPTEVKVDKFVQSTPIINEHADIVEAASQMVESNVDYLPVESNKQIIGVVSALQLAKLAVALPELEKMKISDVKLLKPSKVTKEAPLAMAMEVMYQENVDHVPLFDQGKLYGILSYRDLLRKYLNWSPRRDVSAKFNKAASTRAAQVDISPFAGLPVSSMSTNDNLVTVQKSETLKNAVQLMVKNNISDLIVFSGNDYQGLLTLRNVLQRVGALKIKKSFDLQGGGLSKLGWHPYEVESLQKIASNEAVKLQRGIRNEFTLVIHVKEYDKGGKQKYSMHLRLEFPGKMVSVSADDWDWRTALHKAFVNAENNVKKLFKRK